MRLLAISDLHLAAPGNLAALAELPPHPRDWLILAGDIGEKPAHLAAAFEILGQRFARLLWVPGNHELWTVQADGAALRGEAKYRALVDLARAHGVLTPEDPFPEWPGAGPRCVLAPLFLLYDYSFRPPDVALSDVVGWARAGGPVCADEILLDPTPHGSRQDWCRRRCAEAERRLAAIPEHLSTILINHYPLRYDLAVLPRLPRFTPWCGTRLTEDWHTRFRALAVVHGHLHIRGTRWRDGVRFEEVSLGYARQWDRTRGLGAYLREILPGTPPP